MKQLSSIITISATLLFCGFLTPTLTHAANYWASPQGSSTASCADISGTSDPGRYGSFARAVACATRVGDVVMAKPGTYTSDVTLLNPSSGITIRGSDSNPANWPRLQPSGGSGVRPFHFNNTTRSNITIRYIRWGFSNVTTGQGCVTSSSDASVSNLVVEDFECLGPPPGQATKTAGGLGAGAATTGWQYRRGKVHRWISLDNAPGAHCFYWMGDNGIIENVECENINGHGIQFYDSGSTRPDNNIFRYNKFHNLSLRAPVYIQSGTTGNQVYGNVFYNFNDTGIAMRGTNTKVWNNTLHSTVSGSKGILVECSSGCELRNNIIITNSSPISGSAGTTISNSLTTDPKFVDAGKSNFRLNAQSPAIDKGITLSQVATDVDGTRRPQGSAYDIGAYEYLSTTTSSPASPSNLQANSQ